MLGVAVNVLELPAHIVAFAVAERVNALPPT
jgi:hypothetical protein